LSIYLPARIRKCFYTTREVAEKLGLHLETVLKYIEMGKLPAVLYGRKFLIPKTDVFFKL